MGWQLLLFRLRRRGRPTLVLLAVTLLLAGLAGGWLHSTRQEFRLTINVTDAQFVSAIEVHSACCPLSAAAITQDAPSATFVLQRGAYTITATPSSIGYQQHWYYVPSAVQLTDDRTIHIHGTYGQG